MNWAYILEQKRQQRRDLQRAYDLKQPQSDPVEIRPNAMPDVRGTAERLRSELGLPGDPTSVVPGISPW